MTTNELKLYKVLPKYIELLRDESKGGDESVYIVDGNKSNRPFVGIVAVFNDCNYFIPLTSYKKRFKYLTAKEPDFTPIYRNGNLVAGLEFNKMIPVPLNQIRPLDMEMRKHDSDKRKEAKELRIYEQNWCNKNKDLIIDKATKLYNMYVNKDKNYKNIKYCVNFPKLEILCAKYSSLHQPQHNAISKKKKLM